MYDSWELLSKAPNGGEAEKQRASPSLQDSWTSVAILCQGWSHLSVLAPPTWHNEYQMAKTTQAVLMDCTAVPPEDTRGQEALT